MNSRLVSKQIIDKNGHQRTVRVLADSAVSRTPSIPPKAVRPVVTNPLVKSLDAALAILDSPDLIEFPLESQQAAIDAVNSPDADDEVYDKAAELSEACERWNFHGTSMKLAAGIARARHAQNPDAPLTEMYSLGYDSLTPPALLQRIYDERGAVMHSLSTNTSSPAAVLDAFAADDREWVRENVAQNPSTSIDTLAALSKDSEWRVRHAAVTNPSASRDTLWNASKDSNELVANAAAKILTTS